MTRAPTIRPMERRDLAAVARVHQAAFRGFFLDRMGPAFLRAYYATVLAYPRALALVAEQDGQVVAFAAGFLDPAGFYAHFRARRLRMAPAMALGLLRRPGLLREILGAARRVSAPAAADAAEAGPATAELSSIGAAMRGGGLGSLLLDAFRQGAFASGARRIVLSTDEADNAATRRFYETRGFRMTGLEHRGERTLCLYELTA